MYFKNLIIIYLIISISLTNSLGVIFVYNQIKNYHKHAIREQISSNKLTQTVEILSFSKVELKKGIYKIHFIEKHEFRFNGFLYDIISSWETADSIFYKCINDTKEEELEKNFITYVISNSNRSDLPPIIKSLLGLINYEVFFVASFKFAITFSNLILKIISSDLPQQFKKDVLEPPPRVCEFC